MIRPLFQNILVLVRGGEGSIEAAKYATLMSKLYHSRVHAIYVVDTATIKTLALNKIFIEEESAEYEVGMEETGSRYLEHVREIGAVKSVNITVTLKKGSVLQEVCEYIEENKIDALLVGLNESKQNEILERSFYSMLSQVKCSVIMVKDPKINTIYKMA